MARARKSKPVETRNALEPISVPPGEFVGPDGGETTGKYIVIFKEDVEPAKVKSALSRSAGIKSFTSSADYTESAISGEDLSSGEAAYFPKLGIMVVSGDDDQILSLTTASDDTNSPILAIEPEYVARISSGLSGSSLDYLRGYRDAINHLYDQLTKSEVTEGLEAAMAAFQDTAQFTWGLQATRVNTSRYSGQGIKVAVLDTGFDLRHPDFAGRTIISQSFIAGQTVQDGNGHGTHCVGTACGPQRPVGTRRYGIAYAAQIHVGKVLSDQGSGSTSGIVAGIEWALTKGCKIVSMSLGANINQKIQQYEVPIRRALSAGTLVIAAAGNNAERSAGNFGFVTPPANADGAMAVAAVDSQLAVANFSARSSLLTGVGGKVNIAGPGVNVYSSWPMATRYRTISGTSMATPHVAGIAALWAQATGATGNALWNRLQQTARALSSSSANVGAGLVQAPQ